MKKLILDACLQMLHSGLTVETWGNISCRDSEAGLVYLTPSGLHYDGLTEDDIVVAKLDGAIVEGARKPTIEIDMHLGIYRARPDINAVIHTHPVYSQVFAVLREDIPPVIDEAAQILGGPVRCTPYALPGSPELAIGCVETLGEAGYACLLASHGAVCAGADMEMAFKVSTVLEMTAQIYQMARAIGKPVTLSDDQVAFMHDFAYNEYGQ
ncbi:MAG: class II aldolase/adducin family protein [Clostridiales Family XIII bacterium]|jgi:L-fuculose-phosphate aldolase|nr:class II aldolase/adducin family protein [Clostridiales Family XIII bacterium]